MVAEMLSITAPTYTDPSRYELSNVPRPTVREKTDVIIRVFASSVNPVDVKKAGGVFKAAVKEL
jgi:NADPH:quinone reductase-like Zn-dependent oxidoreductase